MKDQKFKGFTLSYKKCTSNVLRFYNESTNDEQRQGIEWYVLANTYCKELALRFNLSLSQVAGIVAAFSPQTAWLENKRFALTFLLNPKKFVGHRDRVYKAKQILKLTNEADIYKALAFGDKAFKTKAFFMNIMNPLEVTNVTIDRHAIASCMQTPTTTSSLDNRYGTLTLKQYRFFESVYETTAKKLDLKPQELQAIVWTAYRRLRSLRQHETENEYIPF